jgi:hypothetical protein
LKNYIFMVRFVTATDDRVKSCKLVSIWLHFSLQSCWNECLTIRTQLHCSRDMILGPTPEIVLYTRTNAVLTCMLAMLMQL